MLRGTGYHAEIEDKKNDKSTRAIYESALWLQLGRLKRQATGLDACFSSSEGDRGICGRPVFLFR